MPIVTANFGWCDGYGNKPPGANDALEKYALIGWETMYCDGVASYKGMINTSLIVGAGRTKDDRHTIFFETDTACTLMFL